MTGNVLPVPDYIAFDTETTGLSPGDDQIIEVALVRFQDGVPVDRWTSLVRPDKQVGLKTLRLTGIPVEGLTESPTIEAICHKIEEFREHLPLVGHNPEFDTSFLSKPIPGFPGVPVYDTLELARIVYPGFKTYRLSDLARELNVELDEAHRACDDAEASGIIFRLIQERIAGMPMSLRHEILWLMGKEWVPGHLFELDMKDSCYQPSLFEIPPVRSQPGMSLDKPGSSALSPLDSVPGENHLQPDKDDFWIEDVLLGEANQVSINAYLDSNTVRKVIMSSLNVANPEHPVLIAGDFEFLNDVPEGASFLSVPGDYLCVLKANMVSDLARNGFFDSLDVEDKRFLSSVIVWKSLSQDGLFNKIQIAGRGYALRRELCCSEFPMCQDYCPVQDQCYYLKAVKKANGARVILTTKEGCFARPFQAKTCILLGMGDVARVWEGMQPRLDLLKFMDTLSHAGCSHFIPETKKILSESLGVLGRRRDAYIPGKIKEALSFLYADISGVINELRQRVKDPSDHVIKYPLDPPVLSATLHRLEYWMEELRRILVDDEQSISLLERGYSDRSQDNIVFFKKVLWPVLDARKALEDRYGKVVIVSHELSFASRFQGLRQLYGLEDDRIVHKDVTAESSGSKRKDVLLISVDSSGHASGDRHITFTGKFLEELMSQSKENALCLCPSYAFIRNLGSIVTDTLEQNGIAVFAQGVDGGARVIEHLLEPETLALARFGIEVSPTLGISPGILVIPKVPFSPPNVLDELRRNELSARGKDGFVEINVLPVALAIDSYIEALGRSTKRLAVVLLDPKILPGQRGWGRDFADYFLDVRKIVCLPQTAVARIARWIKEGKEGEKGVNEC